MALMRTETTTKRKTYIIAGEPSGDVIGAHVLRAMRSLDLEISGVGGDKMQGEGLASLFDIDEISVGGIVEVIPHILRIRKLIHLTARDIIARRPDVVLTIDSPGFCFRVVKMVRKLSPGIRMIHLVAPSVWAWRPKRAKKLAKLYDVLLTLFEFEPPYFLKHGLNTKYVGHPIIEEFPEDIRKDKDDLVLLMPGSRFQEIQRLLPIFLEFLEKYEVARCVIPTLPYLVPMVRRYLGNKSGIEITTDEDEKNDLYRKARLAIVASGTATLQLAVAGCPMIVCYKLNGITYRIVKLLAKTEYISLVNIISNYRIVPELIQEDCTADRIFQLASETDFLAQIHELVSLRADIRNLDQLPSKKIIDIMMDS
jgi:lipid-A-disaccharide synthase